MIIVVADKGDDPVAAITDAAGQHGLRAAQITGIGGFSRATLGYFDRNRSDYRPFPSMNRSRYCHSSATWPPPKEAASRTCT